jgi:histidinol-phosphate/aromatic aminotransferase/cobyric acid decarboxylase-like protein
MSVGRLARAERGRASARAHSWADMPLCNSFASKNATVLKSATNFVPIRYSSPEEAAARQAALLKEGIAVHRPPHPSMQHLLRVTAGPQVRYCGSGGYRDSVGGGGV